MSTADEQTHQDHHDATHPAILHGTAAIGP